MRALAATVLLATGPAFALQVPVSDGGDRSIRSVEYDPAEVVRLDMAPGELTKIEFGKGEDIVTDGFGREAFLRAPGVGWLMVRINKNKVDDAGGNLIVTTRRKGKERTYVLQINVVKPAQAVSLLRFRFNEEPEEQRVKVVEQRLKERDGAAYNLCYVQTVDPRIVVTNAWDDGLHTWMRIPGESPTINVISNDGTERSAPEHTAESPGLIRIAGTARTWMLHAGGAVKRIDAYDRVGDECVAALGPYSPRQSVTGTVSSTVERVILEAP